MQKNGSPAFVNIPGTNMINQDYNQKDITGNAVSKYLGTEFDLTNSYKFNKFTDVDLALSYMAAPTEWIMLKVLRRVQPG